MSKVEQAFDLMAGCTGRLANAMGKNKMGRRPLLIMVTDLRKAADLLEEHVNV